jgi:hypothetical protein
LMYANINTLAANPEVIVTKMKAHHARIVQDADSDSIEFRALPISQRQSE